MCGWTLATLRGERCRPRTCALLAPCRYGIELEDYQLDPLVRAVQMPHVNLLIADDVGLGKTIETGPFLPRLVNTDRERTETIKNSRLVYSTDFGRACPKCGQPIADCVCRKTSSPAASDGIVRVRREVKGRKGKTVTTITGVPLDEDKLRELASELKRQCGTGGSAKDGIIYPVADGEDLRSLSLRSYEARVYNV